MIILKITLYLSCSKPWYFVRLNPYDVACPLDMEMGGAAGTTICNSKGPVTMMDHGYGRLSIWWIMGVYITSHLTILHFPSLHLLAFSSFISACSNSPVIACTMYSKVTVLGAEPGPLGLLLASLLGCHREYDQSWSRYQRSLEISFYTKSNYNSSSRMSWTFKVYLADSLTNLRHLF